MLLYSTIPSSPHHTFAHHHHHHHHHFFSIPRDARTHVRNPHSTTPRAERRVPDSERSKNKTSNSSRGSPRSSWVKFRQPLSPIPLHTLRHCWPAAPPPPPPPANVRRCSAIGASSLSSLPFPGTSEISGGSFPFFFLSILDDFLPSCCIISSSSGLSPGTSAAKFVL
jgi:hypothetical protein